MDLQNEILDLQAILKKITMICATCSAEHISVVRACAEDGIRLTNQITALKTIQCGLDAELQQLSEEKKEYVNDEE